MKSIGRIGGVLALAAAIVVTFALRAEKRARDAAATATVAAPAATPVAPTAVPGASASPASSPAVPSPAPAAVPPPASAVSAPSSAAAPAAPEVAAARAAAPRARPRLLELGSNRCMACQEMAKVLDALRLSQGERLQVDFVDVNEDLDAMDRYRIKLIPTQILYDGAGTEIFRHIGYFSHDDVLAKFRELGVML